MYNLNAASLFTCSVIKIDDCLFLRLGVTSAFAVGHQSATAPSYLIDVMNSGLILTLLNDRPDGIIQSTALRSGEFGGHISGAMKSGVMTNGEHACVLVFVPLADMLNILCGYKFVFSVLDELFVSHHA